MPTLPSLLVLEDVIVITFSSTSDNKFGIMTTIDSFHDANFAVTVGAWGCHCDKLQFHKWQQIWHHDNYQISFQSCWCQLNCSIQLLFIICIDFPLYQWDLHFQGSLGVWWWSIEFMIGARTGLPHLRGQASTWTNDGAQCHILNQWWPGACFKKCSSFNKIKISEDF